MRPEVPRDDDVKQWPPCTVLELVAYWIYRNGNPGAKMAIEEYLRIKKHILQRGDDET